MKIILETKEFERMLQHAQLMPERYTIVRFRRRVNSILMELEEIKK